MTRLFKLSLIVPVVLFAGCTGDISTDDSTISCYDNGSGLICFGGEGDGGDEQPPDGDAVCEDTNCTTVCHETDYGQKCVTECEGGLRCVKECTTAEGDAEAHCEQACTCPEGDKPNCEEHPDAEGCNTEPDFCTANPDHPECYCKTHPDDPECTNTEPDFCTANPDHPECYCKTHPDDPECTNTEPDFCTTNPDHPECYCKTHPKDPECTGGTDGGGTDGV